MQFTRYSLTGLLGVGTNLSLFYLCVEVLNLNMFFSSISCYMLAATQNYIINHFWSFGSNSKLSIKSWILFLIGSSVSLIINLVVLDFTNVILGSVMVAQALGLLIGFVVNYFFAKKIVYLKT